MCACIDKHIHRCATIWYTDRDVYDGINGITEGKWTEKERSNVVDDILLTFSRILPRFLASFRSTSETAESWANGGCSACLKPQPNTIRARTNTITMGIVYVYCCACCSSKSMWSMARDVIHGYVLGSQTLSIFLYLERAGNDVQM